MKPSLLFRIARLALVVGLLVSLVWIAQPAQTAALVVNSLADNSVNDAFCTLREAITAAYRPVGRASTLSAADPKVI